MTSSKQEPETARSPNIYQLLALDMDGTLLNPQKVITPAVHEAIRAYIHRGGRVTIASGRFPASVWLHARATGMNAPLVALNGAVILNEATGELRQGTALPAEHVRELIRFVEGRGAYIQLYGYNKLYVRELNDMNARWPLANVVVSLDKELNEKNYAQQMKMIQVVAVGDLQRFVSESASDSLSPAPPIYKATVIGQSQEIISELMEALEKQQTPQPLGQTPHHGVTQPPNRKIFTLTRTGRHRFDVNAYGVSKRTALEALCRELHIPSSGVAAVGDYDNDIAMLSWAGLGVAMGNAGPHIKQFAKVVTGSNEEDGVARVIQNYLL
ncbi:HAD family hydrolase [Paenibacillus lentus]|uniref:HAD family hydrolase n=1 Tax=Paenibacillus lentus TaxID=1338368 RepID=A0A3S8RSS4_9BACL|nr:HAD family hydrolase [Paenibacillus lentus]AZK45853.1 HAD family hydrolase [Paenibacillus lentus]